MRIIVDAMGGDYSPSEIIKGSVMAANRIRNINIILVGKENLIRDELNKYEYPSSALQIINANEVITNEDIATKAIKTKKDSSIVKSLKMLKNGEGDAFVSAGSTGALLAGSLLILGRIDGIDRPALTPLLPTSKGCILLADAGANTNCRPENFLQFGIMGSIYMNKVIGINEPRVGMVNVGIEEGKGNNLTKKAYNLLKSAQINFTGNIEARQIPTGDADVIVCDGFVGNVILKLIEGMGLTFYSNVKNLFTKSILSYIAALFVKNGLKEFKKKMDYSEYGGAPLLGINNVVIKSHGSSKATAIFNAINQAKKFVEMDVINEIKNSIVNLEEYKVV